MDYLTTHTSLSPIWCGFVNYKKGCTRLTATSDKVYQLLVHGRWFSLGTPASSTTKTGPHDIAESGIKHQKSADSGIKHQKSINQSKMFSFCILLQKGLCRTWQYKIRASREVVPPAPALQKLFRTIGSLLSYKAV